MAEAGLEPDQAAIVAALESGAATGDPSPLRRIDTHMSRVFIGPYRAYKLKRSRCHPFADFSTPALRHAGCEAELAVNRALAPGLYEAVLPVVERDGGYRLGGEGEAVDWVVVMQRFADEDLFSAMAARGALTAEQITQAVDAVAAFHAASPPVPGAGHAADYREVIDGLRRTEAEAATGLGLEPGSDEIYRGLERAIVQVSPLIEARREAGFVRRGHGDLHLRNICLFQGRATPFDALEFDARLATTDVIYDLAFLLMDLRARGMDALANRSLNAYWDASGQAETALALVGPFMALRAAVRMAVAVEAADLGEALRYRRLALRLLRPAPAPPRLVAVGGLSGTGKSSLARLLAPDQPGPCGARLLRTDVIRKSPSGPGAAYAFDDRQAVYRVLSERAAAALAAGAAVIADATFRDEGETARIEAAAGGRPFVGLWLRADTEARATRIAGRRGDASDATPEIARAQLEPEAMTWTVLDADRPLAAIAEAARAVLAIEATST